MILILKFVVCWLGMLGSLLAEVGERLLTWGDGLDEWAEAKIDEWEERS